jgi:hypothetical protein
VKIDDLSEALMPLLPEIRNEVSQEWCYEKEKQLRATFMEELQKKYNVATEQHSQSTL